MDESSEDTSGDSTDVFSSKFDPLKALHADTVHVPDTQAPIFDNISKFESYCFKALTTKTVDSDTQIAAEKTTTAKSGIFQDSTRPIIRARKNIFSAKNVVSRMEKSIGPLSALYQYMENKIKVKIYTRSIDGIRGYIEAYIVAFDTHWNLALEDCIEVWTRKTKRKTLAVGGIHKIIAAEVNTGHTSIVKKQNKRMETVERHISQLLLRGEQIVLIVKIE